MPLGIKWREYVTKDMTCRGFQYELGKEYTHEGELKLCPSEQDARSGKGGFHSCEQPIYVFRFYSPATSKFCEVDASGEQKSDGIKTVSKEIKIGAEIGIPGLCKAQFEYVKSHTNNEHTDENAATAGDSGAATAGDRGFALSGGKSFVGENGIAAARGTGPMAKGLLGSTLVLVLTDDEYNPIFTIVEQVDGDRIKENTWYTIESGKIQEVL